MVRYAGSSYFKTRDELDERRDGGEAVEMGVIVPAGAEWGRGRDRTGRVDLSRAELSRMQSQRGGAH